MRRTSIPTLLLATVSLLGVLAPLPPFTASAAAMRGGDPAPAPVRRSVQIDGRWVTVELLLLQVIGGAPIEGGNTPRTTAHVTLSINDGALLPAGLEADAVQFEKRSGVNRAFVTRLTDVGAGDGGEFELVQELYQGDLPNGITAQSFRSVVLLSHNGAVIRVPMGLVPVHVLALP